MFIKITVNIQQTLDLKQNLSLSCQSLPPRRNRVKKSKTQSRIDSEPQRNFKTQRLCDFASLPSGELFLFLFFAGKKRKEITSLSCLQHFDNYPVMIAGIPSYALHTCLGTVVPHGTFKLKVENWLRAVSYEL